MMPGFGAGGPKHFGHDRGSELLLPVLAVVVVVAATSRPTASSSSLSVGSPPTSASAVAAAPVAAADGKQSRTPGSTLRTIAPQQSPRVPINTAGGILPGTTRCLFGPSGCSPSRASRARINEKSDGWRRVGEEGPGRQRKRDQTKMDAIKSKTGDKEGSGR